MLDAPVALTFDETRRVLRRRQDCKFVGPHEFCSLLVSTRKLLRADQTDAGLRGLLDEEAGVRILIEEERLFSNDST